VPRKSPTPTSNTKKRVARSSRPTANQSNIKSKTIHRTLVDERRSLIDAKRNGSVDEKWIDRSVDLLDQIDAWFAGTPFVPELSDRANMRRFRSYMHCMKRAHSLLLAVERELLKGSGPDLARACRLSGCETALDPPLSQQFAAQDATPRP
jgi:hypothetical protein